VGGTSRRLEVDLLVERLPPQSFVPIALVYPNGSYAEVTVEPSPMRVGLCDQNVLDGGRCGFSASALPLNQWLHLELALDFDAGVGRLTTSGPTGVLPGVSVASHRLSLQFPIGEPEAVVGLQYVQVPTTAPLQFSVDNFVVRAQ